MKTKILKTILIILGIIGTFISIYFVIVSYNEFAKNERYGEVHSKIKQPKQPEQPKPPKPPKPPKQFKERKELRTFQNPKDFLDNANNEYSLLRIIGVAIISGLCFLGAVILSKKNSKE